MTDKIFYILWVAASATMLLFMVQVLSNLKEPKNKDRYDEIIKKEIEEYNHLCEGMGDEEED